MREIKFRGQSNQGEWIYGYPIIKSYKAWMKDMHDNTTNPRKLYMDYADYRCIEVDKETIGQYTGIKDKNGKEIYEGDILQTKHSGKTFTGKVYYQAGTWYGACDYLDVFGGYFKCEVVGNIYDNPEMLGVE